jgi:hypothetical protein
VVASETKKRKKEKFVRYIKTEKKKEERRRIHT